MAQQEFENDDDNQEIEELTDWISRTVKRLKDDEPALIIITAASEYGRDVIDRIDGAEGLESLDELAQKIYDTAAKDAHGVGGSATYFVTMEGVEGRHALTFGPVDDGQNRAMTRYEGGGGGMVRPGYGPGGPMGRVPVEGWVTYAQLRDKHEQFLYDASLGERKEVYKLMQRVITEQSETIRNYEKERARERQLIEELTSAKHIRDMEIERMKREEARRDNAIELVKPWAHGIGARIFGPKGIPQGMNPILNQILTVFSTFTPEQVQGITTTGRLELTERQKVELLGMLSTIVNLSEQVEAEARKNGATSSDVAAK